MSPNHPLTIGRVLSSSTTRIIVGCQALLPEVPNFGDFVKVAVPNGTTIIGLIYNVAFGDDMLVRQLISTPNIPEETLRDQRENRQIPIEIAILVVGFDDGNGMHAYLPPQPPPALNELSGCTAQEICAFTERFDYFRTVLNAGGDLPADELLAATLRQASRCRGQSSPDRQFLIDAGRELVRLLNDDLTRLDGLLRRIKP